MESDKVQEQSGKKHEEDSEHMQHEYLVTVFVNEQQVKLLGHTETGEQVKAAAIEQGVPIHLRFILEEKLPDGTYRIVADHERVQLHEGLHFTAHEVMFTVYVNEQPVKLHGHKATGAEIKEAAIKQGVHIQQNFILQEELPNGTSRIVGDNDKVHLHDHLRFTAIAPDDNSWEEDR